MTTYHSLREANAARQESWCVGGDPVPDLAFRGIELAGEAGEALNVVKKIERERHGWRGSRATIDDLAEEIADVVICADLLALAAGIDLDAAVERKFNATSEKVGLPQRLAFTAHTPASVPTEKWLVAAFGACVDADGLPLQISFKGWTRDNGLKFMARAILSALSPSSLPYGYEAVRDADGRATGAIRPVVLLSARTLECEHGIHSEGRCPYCHNVARWQSDAANNALMLQDARLDRDDARAENERLTKELERFREERPYVVGWNDGFAHASAAQAVTEARRFQLGDRVTKTKGSSWTGRVVGFYSTTLTPIGYAVESESETGSVQIYPESTLAAAQVAS